MIFKAIEKIQLAFWNTVIYVLDEIKPARLIVQKTYWSFENGSLQQILSTSLFVSLAGFLSGIFLFLVYLTFGG
ncbi:MAG: hypothetical protein IT308_01945 [Anaerolineaceae bacterium]|nr:hypothetical protein [Anaerolineaceae bacterium]